jgi:two-component system response regulator YesN
LEIILFYEELSYFIQIENEDTEDFKSLEIDLAFNLRREIKKRFNISIRAGLGEIYNSVEQIVESYRQATKCLVYNSDNVNIIHINDIDENMLQDKFINESKITDGKDNKNKNINKIKLKLFEDVKDFIKENIASELEQEKVAGNFGLSVYYFSRTFKEVTGTNFSDYINKCRIDIAKELLSNGEMNVKEVCFKVGYNDPNYFSKVFKKYEGISPANYKIINENEIV